MKLNIEIAIDTLQDGKVEALLEAHLAQMHHYSPEGSIHALDKQKMREPNMTFWSARTSGQVMGCGALKQLDDTSAELKSMKTCKRYLRMGVAEALLNRILTACEQRGYKKVYLETGSHEAFKPAVGLYQKYGFIECEPFTDYQPDPFSRFFVKTL